MSSIIDSRKVEEDAKLLTLYLVGKGQRLSLKNSLYHFTPTFLLGPLQYVFDYRPGDVYACVADIGWITGHSYVVYGPLCNGATTVLFESIPTYPDPGMPCTVMAPKSCNCRL